MMASKAFHNLPDVNSHSSIEAKSLPQFSSENSFPLLSDKVFYGLAGEVVKTIEPETEADNAALLIQFLAGFGSLIGKTAYFKIGADFHYMKLFVVLVGATSRGRKGTSWSEIKRVLVRADESFHDCIQDGLSSGEGLIFHVRDAQTKKVPIKQKGRIIDYQDELFDEGAKEKRAFIVEPEFARVLKVISREGNTLSSVIRQAWDTDRLRVMTKNPIKASDAHVSIVGHITETELIRNLEETETANGFANRFLWVCVRRSKYLPNGGSLSENSLNELARRLSEAVLFARKTGEVKRDSEANELWHQDYKKLSDGYDGILGSVTSRATAQVMRLACIYALLDVSDKIRREHLEAALALWQFCEDSAKYVFGMTTGDKVADEIFSALNRNKTGMTKTQISNLFNRNLTAKQIETALQKLIESERVEKIEEKTQGRPREVFKISNYEINEINEKGSYENQIRQINSSISLISHIELCPNCNCKFDKTPSGQIFCSICLYTK